VITVIPSQYVVTSLVTVF